MDLLRSLPLGLYLEKPVTWLHQLDPRVKLFWLMSFLLSPLLASPLFRLALAGLLILLTLTAKIPLRVWKQQMGWLLTLCILAFFITLVASDGLAVNHQLRLPPSDLNLPQPTNYQYILFQKSWVTVTRRSLDLGVRISSLVFTLIYSTNVYLLTTAPEEITAGIESLTRPLERLKIPITEIVLTLTLSLRFIPLVLEEIQNLTRSIRTRAINWKKLGIRKSGQVWISVLEKLLENLLVRAEQIAIAMEVRGFTGPNEHRVEWHQLRIHRLDWLAIVILVAFWFVRFQWGWMS